MLLSEQRKINNFVRDYADKHFRQDLNKIKISSANSTDHNLQVCRICCVLTKYHIPFMTEFKTKFGLRFDIATPTHTVKFIEVLGTETKVKFKEFKLPKLPSELKNEYYLITTKERPEIVL